MLILVRYFKIFQAFNNKKRLLSNVYKSDTFIKQLLQNKETSLGLFHWADPLIDTSINHKNNKLIIISSEQFKEIEYLNNLKIFINHDSPQLAISFYDIHRNELQQLLKEKLNIDCIILKGYKRQLLFLQDFFKNVIGLLSWHYSNMFCGICGMKTLSVELGCKRICSDENCTSRKFPDKHAWVNHPRIDPVVAVLATTKSDMNGSPSCLLARKASFPPNFISCITGFMDPGESAEAAAIRELKEEVNLSCEHYSYVSSEYYAMPSSLFLGYIIQVPSESNQIVVDQSELSFAQWFNIREVKMLLEGKHSQYKIPPKYSIMGKLIEKWYHDNMK